MKILVKSPLKWILSWLFVMSLYEYFCHFCWVLVSFKTIFSRNIPEIFPKFSRNFHKNLIIFSSKHFHVFFGAFKSLKIKVYRSFWIFFKKPKILEKYSKILWNLLKFTEKYWKIIKFLITLLYTKSWFPFHCENP